MTLTIPCPGTIGGPCHGGCEHDRCHDARALASKRCCVCGQFLGWEVPIVDDDPARAAHAACVRRVQSAPKPEAAPAC